MTYENFKQELLSMLPNYLPSDVSYRVESVLKNNSVSLDGLLFITPTTNMFPTLYLNHYYHAYEKGCSMDILCEKILEHFTSSKHSHTFDITFFEQLENVKSNIFFKLISREKNQTLLLDVPHIPYLDLAIVFYYYMPKEQHTFLEEDVNATILLHHQHLQAWKISPEEVFQFALKNTPKTLSPQLFPLYQILSDLLPLEEEDASSIFVLTNRQKFFGASVLLYPDILTHIATLLQDDFYIIPCSIHEVLLLPMKENNDTKAINNMIQEVNRDHVLAEEVLSDHVYWYDREQNKICY